MPNYSEGAEPWFPTPNFAAGDHDRGRCGHVSLQSSWTIPASTTVQALDGIMYPTTMTGSSSYFHPDDMAVRIATANDSITTPTNLFDESIAPEGDGSQYFQQLTWAMLDNERPPTSALGYRNDDRMYENIARALDDDGFLNDGETVSTHGRQEGYFSFQSGERFWADGGSN
ncbi:Enolase-phosphatase E1 [Sphaceloma murrayae]|uniref:Enolase-phosphatase E1 n=1 Tax=Sphaceloma murrayae TaxID=2082308 RepID=A0A2K1QVM4_9PEZI|nr:Enolase-phosphatase E1 [Sphaceloma murrayae]